MNKKTILTAVACGFAMLLTSCGGWVNVGPDVVPGSGIYPPSIYNPPLIRPYGYRPGGPLGPGFNRPNMPTKPGNPNVAPKPGNQGNPGQFGGGGNQRVPGVGPGEGNSNPIPPQNPPVGNPGGPGNGPGGLGNSPGGPNAD